MGVRSRNISNPSAAAKESAVISRAQLRRQRGCVERISAWMVLAISFLGSIAALVPGGWNGLLAGETIPWGSIAAGLLAQAVLTWLQWSYFDVFLIAWPSRVADATLTALGYGPLIAGGLIAYLASRGVSAPNDFYGAWGIIGLFGLVVAWYPESRLVE